MTGILTMLRTADEDGRPCLNPGFVADEIERLYALLYRYRHETPLGHQPHMIAHKADEALENFEPK